MIEPLLVVGGFQLTVIAELRTPFATTYEKNVKNRYQNHFDEQPSFDRGL